MEDSSCNLEKYLWIRNSPEALRCVLEKDTLSSDYVLDLVYYPGRPPDMTENC